jgi:hypothetical protein
MKIKILIDYHNSLFYIDKLLQLVPNIDLVDNLGSCDLVYSPKWTSDSKRFQYVYTLLPELKDYMRKDTFIDLLSDKPYIPSIGEGRVFVKDPLVDGSKGIRIMKTDSEEFKILVENKRLGKIDYQNLVFSPEIKTPLTEEGHKYDWRVWIIIKLHRYGEDSDNNENEIDMEFYVLSNMMQRIAREPYPDDDTLDFNALVTNVSNTGIPCIYDMKDTKFYNQCHEITGNLLGGIRWDIDNIHSGTTKFMLTGWDFIEDVLDHENPVKLLEINIPGMSSTHKQMLQECFNWIRDNK